MGDSAAECGDGGGWGESSGAVCAGVQLRGDQFELPPGAPAGDVGAMGGGGAGGLPVFSEVSEDGETHEAKAGKD